MSNVAYGLLTAFFAFLSGVIAWYFKGKKISADARGSELNNVEKAIEIWRDISEELRAQNEVLQQKIEKLTQTVAWLESEQKTLINENRELRSQIENFQTLLKNAHHES